MSDYHIKGRKVECNLCGRTVGAHNYSRVCDPDPARHKCPHGVVCQFSLDALGPSCKQCRDAKGFPKAAIVGESSAAASAPLPLDAPVADLVDTYMRLLRRAWLNPSHKPYQMAVHAFEHRHDARFELLWKKWRALEGGVADWYGTLSPEASAP